MSDEVIWMLERVARAICLQANIDDGYRDNAALRGSIDMGMWKNHVQQARVAIAAMREPNEAMLSAGKDANLLIADHRTVKVWAAMIDAALNEKK